MKERLDEGGGRRRIDPDAAGFGGLLTVFVALLLVAAALPARRRADQVDFTVPDLLIVVGLMLLMAGSVFGTAKAVGWAFPALEILPRDGRRRWERVRKRVLVAVGSVTLGVALLAAEQFLF